MQRGIGVRSGLALVAALVLVGSGAARASTGAAEAEPAAGAPKAAAEPAAAAGEPAAAEPAVPHVEGPRHVDLGNEIEIDLPAGFVLYERAQARELLQKGGSNADNVLAL